MYINIKNTVISLTVIIYISLISGCTTETTITPDLSYAKQAYGHVYLNGAPVNGASIVAVPINGNYRISAVTNESGEYKLNLVPWVKYNVTATYQSYSHTIWPVYLTNITEAHGTVDDIVDRYDINLTSSQKSIIAGIVLDKSRYKGSNVTITASSSKGNISDVTADDGAYFLEVEPNTTYTITGKYIDHDGRFVYLSLLYRNDGWVDEIKLNPQETAYVDYYILIPVPPIIKS